MPALHHSVTLCDRTDLYVATIEVSSCLECGGHICAACAIDTIDSDLRVCSPKCRALANRRIREQDAPAPEAA
jgi:hypothetical protein